MPSIKDLKKRIGSVKNTQQTTRAMKMVSAAKLRRAQEAIQSQRPFANRIAELLHELLNSFDSEMKHPLLRQSSNEAREGQKKKVLLVVLTSDRGLCGGFNSNVIKSCQRWLDAAEGLELSVELACVGRKGHDFFKNKNVKVAQYYPEVGGKVTFAKARTLSSDLVARFLNGDYDEIKFIYNQFLNAVTQKITVEDFLPLQAGAYKANLNSDKTSEVSESNYIVKPNREELLKELLNKNFSVQAFKILLESQAGEHGARMSSMENATKNAGEMIRKLTLQYNKQRQAGITKELLEIISGSESQKG